jgi:hypothetical protein
MIRLIRAVLVRLGLRAGATTVPTFRIRLRITRSLLMALHGATAPKRLRGEPLAFLRVRFASESAKDVVIAVGISPFPDDAYVDGPAGANFDTRWSIRSANDSAGSNAGLLLAHRHGGKGKPTFSLVDRKTNLTVMVPLSHGMPTVPYGAIVLSDDDATAVIAFDGKLLNAQVQLVADALGRMGAAA